MVFSELPLGTLSADTWAIIFSGIEAVGIIGALWFTVSQQRKLQNEIRFQAHNTTVDRMYQIRTLLIEDPDLYHIWDGGIEGEALKNSESHKYFYLVKMLLHMNESIFLEMLEKKIKKSARDETFGPWRENLKTDLTAPKFRDVWTKNRIVRDSYDPQFAAEVNAIIQEIERGDVEENTVLELKDRSFISRFLGSRG